jgi:hypothetical protein
MTVEKWQELLSKIKDNFEVVEDGKENLEDEGGAMVEYIVFDGPLGKIRLEFITKPMILDKKTIYSNRIGSETKVEYVYSDTEYTHKLQVYRWDLNSGNWQPIDAGNFEI